MIFFMGIYFLLFSLFFSANTFAKDLTSPLSKIKRETELKINLSLSGFRKFKNLFLSKYDGETSLRTDFYFDIFKENHYLLRTLSFPVKLRITREKNDSNWQVKKTILTDESSLFTIKTTNSASLFFPLEKSFIKLMDDYDFYLEKADSYALILAQKMQEELSRENIFSFSQKLCQNDCPEDAEYFLAYRNKKERVKIDLRLGGDLYSLFVGQTENREILTYELEVEIKTPFNPDDLSSKINSLTKWLKKNGFNDSDLEHQPSSDPAYFSESQLKKISPL